MQNLLLLHGALGSKDQFDILVHALQDSFNVYTLNFAGHGGSELPDEFSLETFSNDIINYIESNNLAPVNIFGYSMGGYVALDVAGRRPELVNRIFTFATKFNWSPEIAAREIKMLDAEKIAEKLPRFADQLAQRHAPNAWKTILQKTAKFMTALGDGAPLQLEHIKNKVQIGIGDKDAMVTLEETIDAFRKIPGSSLVVFPETPHPLEKIPLDRLAREIREFLI